MASSSGKEEVPVGTAEVPVAKEMFQDSIEREKSSNSKKSSTPTDRKKGRKNGGKMLKALCHVVDHGVPLIVGAVHGWCHVVARIVLGRPIQTGLLVANVFLVKIALTSLRRARFAASVRVVKDLKNAQDLRYLLGQLPPWISSPEWEAGKPFQELLGLLWPALNSTICLALKNVIEDRMQSSAEYGHIQFSRFSLGRAPPVICGIKAVPLHEEDLLALVVDLDVRWAGEPDVVLHLTKVSRATLGLKNLQISTMVRLVFSPIIEDPPFLQRMTVSLLNKPLIDFNLRALGGPDIMSLPAISSWLHAAILNVTDRFIVWPKEVSVPLVPHLRNKNLPTLSPISSSPPLGVIVVKIEEARLQKRRSTFLGRYKLPNPRIAMVTPKDEHDGVPQMTLTSVKEKTLFPSWKHSRAFVIGSVDQPLRFLLSHRRVENFFNADMPLGSAEVDVSELFTGRHVSSMEHAFKGDTSTKSFKSCISTKSREHIDNLEDQYQSASSGSMSPVKWEAPVRHVAFASPSIHMEMDSPFRGKPANPLAEMVSEKEEGGGTDMLERRIFKEHGGQADVNGKNCPWTPPTKLAVPWQSDCADSEGLRRVKNSSTQRLMVSSCQNGTTWIEINSSPAMTMSGLVANALQPSVGATSTPFEGTQNDTGGDAGYGKSWMQSFKSFMMKSAFHVEYDSDNESEIEDNPSLNPENSTLGHHASAAKVKISYRWIPVSTHEVLEKKNIGRGSTIPAETAGVLGVRVAFTKIDYGDNPPNPILSFSVTSAPSPYPLRLDTSNENNDTLFSEFAQKTCASNSKVFSTECQVGHRPGVLLWGQVFHFPVWRADKSKIRVELGNISSALKLSSYGNDLFLLEASGGSFDDDVDVEASAHIPLTDVIKKGIVEGNYRLREAKTEKMAGVHDDQRLDIGRVVLSLAWYPCHQQDDDQSDL